jgi:hypothetical protein
LCTGIVFFLTSQYLEVNDIKWYSKLRWPNAMFTLREIFYNEKFRARAWQAKTVAVRSAVLHLKSYAGAMNCCSAGRSVGAAGSRFDSEIRYITDLNLGKTWPD